MKKLISEIKSIFHRFKKAFIEANKICSFERWEFDFKQACTPSTCWAVWRDHGGAFTTQSNIYDKVLWENS